MLAEIETLEMRHQYLVSTYRAKLNRLGIGDRFDELYGNNKAYMKVEINTKCVEKKPTINLLSICKSLLLSLQMYICWGGGGVISTFNKSKLMYYE